ncbi:MAG: branched-chain amino acid aminotransferase [Rickettsiales bacterium]|nr:branched-chain amino acid aminotransferase [Rickettsiales bacterium]
MEIIPFDQREGHIWMNGEFVPWGDAKLHVLSHGLHYGSAVFEGERVYDSQVFKLQEHGERLHHSAKLLDFEIPYSAQVLDEAVMELVEKQGVQNGYVRRFAWRGSEMMAISAQHNTTHVAIATWPWPNMYKGKSGADGIKMKTADWKRPSPETAPCQSKAAGLYMICTMSKHKVEREGYHDALMLDWRGYVAEATGANIFFVFDGEVHTPTADCFLNGITRRTVMSLLEKQGYKVVERHIKPEEIVKADEAFLTGTAAEITRIASIDEHQFTSDKVSKAVKSDYTDLVHTKV